LIKDRVSIVSKKIIKDGDYKVNKKELKAQRKAEAEAKRQAEAKAKGVITDNAITKEDAEAKAIAQRNKENADKINATTLGRIANDLRQCESDLEKHTILTVAARKYHTSTISLSEVVNPYLNKVSEEGKLETRKVSLARVQSLAFVDCQYRNTLNKLVVDGMTAEQMTAFLKASQDASVKLVNALHSNEGTTSATQGYAYFVHSPLKNLFTDEEITEAEYYLVSTGWDGKRNFPYYGVRMTPSDNPKNTREIQYTRPEPIDIDSLTSEVTEAVPSETQDS
jgi:hypothetical protein